MRYIQRFNSVKSAWEKHIPKNSQDDMLDLSQQVELYLQKVAQTSEEEFCFRYTSFEFFKIMRKSGFTHEVLDSINADRVIASLLLLLDASLSLPDGSISDGEIHQIRNLYSELQSMAPEN